MDSTRLRNLKHELRTPVNHILGYSELLLEAATDTGDTRAVGRAEHLHAVGQNLARAVEKSLAHTSDPLEASQIKDLHGGLQPLVHQILDLAAPECELHGMNGSSADLKKICQAAEQLLELVHGCGLAASS